MRADVAETESLRNVVHGTIAVTFCPSCAAPCGGADVAETESPRNTVHGHTVLTFICRVQHLFGKKRGTRPKDGSGKEKPVKGTMKTSRFLSILFLLLTLPTLREARGGELIPPVPPIPSIIPSIPYDEFFINGISISSTYDEVVVALGRPVRVNELLVTGGPGQELFYDGLEVLISGDETVNITVSSPKYTLKNGLHVGSTRVEVFKKLGEAPETLNNHRTVVRYVVKTPKVTYADAELIIYLEEDLVVEIVFFFDYV